MEYQKGTYQITKKSGIIETVEISYGTLKGGTFEYCGISSSAYTALIGVSKIVKL